MYNVFVLPHKRGVTGFHIEHRVRGWENEAEGVNTGTAGKTWRMWTVARMKRSIQTEVGTVAELKRLVQESTAQRVNKTTDIRDYSGIR